MAAANSTALPKGTIDLRGRRFGSWVVASYVKRGYWTCRCDCGTERAVNGYTLSRGHTTSCGCKRPQLVRDFVTKHGGAYSHEYWTWSHMKRRCTDTMSRYYKDYGGRGIVVCERWTNSFAAFLEDMGQRPSTKHTIERIDNDKGYSPDNCRWATYLEQGQNKRNNRNITFRGETKTVSAWSREFGVSITSILRRIAYGWPLELALTKPPRKMHRRTLHRS